MSSGSTQFLLSILRGYYPNAPRDDGRIRHWHLCPGASPAPVIRLQFNQAVRYSFASSKKDNSINVRELMSAVLAIIHWGPSWTSIGRDRAHVCMWIDNTNAVAWLSNTTGQRGCTTA